MMLRCAAVQPPAYVIGRGAIAKNVAAMRPLVLKAAGDGAAFALLPELSLQGYTYHLPLAWEGVDRLPADLTSAIDPDLAPAAAALCALASESGLHVGATILEYVKPRDKATHGDVLNTFIVATPEGRLHGEASSKVIPAHFESYVFASGKLHPARSGRVLSVPSLSKRLKPASGAGEKDAPDAVRIGVSICNDNYHPDSLLALASAQPRPHFIAAPHAAMVPGATVGFPLSESLAMRRTLQGAALSLANTLVMPAVTTNAGGTWPSDQRLPWLFGPLTSVMMRDAAFPPAANIAAPGAMSQEGSAALVASSVGGGEEPAVAVGDIPIIESAPDGSIEEKVKLATARDGQLALPVLLQRNEWMNGGSGRLWYRWNGALRDRTCNPSVVAAAPSSSSSSTAPAFQKVSFQPECNPSCVVKHSNGNQNEGSQRK